MTPIQITCVCGGTTLEAFVRRTSAGTIGSCWIRLEPDGAGRPGCEPDARTRRSSNGATDD